MFAWCCHRCVVFSWKKHRERERERERVAQALLQSPICSE